MGSDSSSDPRIRRTRRYLQDALLALLEQQNVRSITVQEITAAAEVNRTTFYLHFRDKDDLVSQTLDALFDDLVHDERLFVDAHSPLSPETPPAPLVNLFEKIGKRPRLYQRLLTDDGPCSFITRLDHFHEEQFLRHWSELGMSVVDDESPAAFRATFAATAIHGALSWWLDQGQDESAETVVAWLWRWVSPAWFPHATSA